VLNTFCFGYGVGYKFSKSQHGAANGNFLGLGADGKVSLVNCSFWGPIDRCVWMRSAVGQFTASACHFVHWDNRGVGSPAIQLDAGKAIVGCRVVRIAEDSRNLGHDPGIAIVVTGPKQRRRGLLRDELLLARRVARQHVIAVAAFLDQMVFGNGSEMVHPALHIGIMLFQQASVAIVLVDVPDNQRIVACPGWDSLSVRTFAANR
jgi:hypothetical protein